MQSFVNNSRNSTRGVAS